MLRGKLVLIIFFSLIFLPFISFSQESYQATVRQGIVNILGDAEENDQGEMYVTSTDLEMVFDGANQIVGMHFPNIGLPKGAQIDNAYIQFSVDESSTSNCQINFRFELTDNALPIQQVNYNLSSRNYTPFSVNWAPAAWNTEFERGARQKTPDLSSLVQEIVDREGWQSGNSMLVKVAGTGNRTAIAYDKDPVNAPELVIEATIPLPNTPITGLYINELMAAGTRVLDDVGEPSDWVELYNSTSEPINIGGLYFTDDLTDLRKWRFLSAMSIPPGEFGVLWLDGETEQGDRHASFKLSKEGEEFAIVQVLNDVNTVLDQVVFPELEENISYGRLNDGQSPWVKFSQLSPNASNDGKGRFLDAKVDFSQKGGVYASSPSISMQTTDPSAQIYYTTDGSEPSIQSTLYTGPVSLSEPAVLRANVFKPGFAGGSITTETYIVRANHQLPILTLQTEPENLWDNTNGIYVQGINGTGGFCADGPKNWNQDWERPCYLNFYEEDGTEAFAVNAGVKIGGGCSRGFKMKSLNFYFRKRLYGDGKVEYPVFPQLDIQEYDRLKIRNSGNDFVQMGFRDGAIQSILFNTVDIDMMAYRPVVAYINGEYWGLYGLRELYNQDYIASHHEVDPDNLDIITNPYAGGAVSEGDGDAFAALVNYIENNDLSNQQNFDYVASQIDMNEFMNYYIVQIYLANYDWPANNLRVWRERDNGKWRWMLYDLDASTGYAAWTQSTASHNTLEFATTTSGDWWPNGPHSTLFLRKLLENTAFRDEFVQRTATYSKLIFNPAKVNHVTDSIKRMIDPEIARHTQKWNNRFWEFGGGNPGSADRNQWEGYIRTFKSFFVARFNSMRNHMKFKFNLGLTYSLTFNHTKDTQGKVYFHTNELEIPPQFQAEYFEDLPINVKAVANPGYVFLKWEETGDSNPEILLTGSDVGTLTPVFIPIEPSITEIHYNPKEGSAFEFLEIHNPSTGELDISGYYFSSGIEFEFPQGTILSEGEFILLTKDKNLYSSISCKLFQWTSGDLDDSGELLELRGPDNRIADQVRYANSSPWPLEANGMGKSLSLEKPYLDNEQVENWGTSFSQGGTPCGEMPPSGNIGSGETFTVRIYPNPAQDMLKVAHASVSVEPLHLEIMNISGQVIKTHDFESNSFERIDDFSIQDLPAGTYIFRFGNENTGLKQELVVKL